jgi:hypothetical protein
VTAEIAVMNRQGVALAADSAVTIETSEGGRKAWQSANKIFGMSHRHPVGIMVYGGGDVLGVPWETVIKMYRDQLGHESFGRLSEYADDFVGFLEGNQGLFPRVEQERWFTALVSGHYRRIVGRMEDRLRELFPDGSPLTVDDVRAVLSDVVAAEYARLETFPRRRHLTAAQRRRVTQRCRPLTVRVRREVFQDLPLTSTASRRLRECVELMLTRDVMGPRASGVVIAGFGDDEHFPCIEHFQIDGIAGGELNYIRDEPASITVDSAAWMRAFAQGEMVAQFMEGVDPRYQEVIEQLIVAIIAHYPSTFLENVRLSKKRKDALQEAFDAVSQELSEGFRLGLERLRYEYYSMPVVNVVTVLPKDELAAMAEALVNLTSVRRRLSFNIESVGGPIDVAVISKGDGFVWIKRKKYFSLDHNPHFMARYKGARG